MKTIVLRTAGLLFSASLLAASLSAQERGIDTKQSTLIIHVGKTGALSAFGHEHTVRGVIDSGRAEAGAHPFVEVHVNARALKVIDEGESDKARAEVQRTMLGPSVLDCENFKEIVFTSTSADSAGEGKWTLHGTLTLHGQTRPATVHLTLKGGHYTGDAIVKQTDFGIQPPGKAGIRAKDEVRVTFDVRLTD